MTDDGYFDYLKRRSVLGRLYRNGWLYPILNRHLHGRTLDVGCGIGDMLRFRKGTVGVDIDPAAVDWCRSLGFEAHVMTVDVLPFEAAAFDSIILDNVLEHLIAPANLLAEIRRVLRTDGTLLVGVPGERGYASDPDHKRFYDRTALAKTIEGAGFRTAKLFNTPFRSTWLDRRLSPYCTYGVFKHG